MSQKLTFLSYTINETTPTYGNRDKVVMKKQSSMTNGDKANCTHIQTTTHIGTHIDMPYHFFNEGQTIIDFEPSFWIFQNPLIVCLEPKQFILENELTEKLKHIPNKNFDILIIKTNQCYQRDTRDYWESNIGFPPSIYDYIKSHYPSIRVMGFDSISLTSYTNRPLGALAHKTFLNPQNPLLILEDMDLRYINEKTKIAKLIIAPLRIENCDGIPCTIFAFENN